MTKRFGTVFKWFALSLVIAVGSAIGSQSVVAVEPTVNELTSTAVYPDSAKTEKVIIAEVTGLK